MREQGELREADAYCRFLAERHYENFTVASKLLPAAVRVDLARIYAFCRTTDDLGDESGDVDRARARLARWRDEVEQMFEGRSPIHPVLIALRETVGEHRLSARPFLDLIAANVQDQEVFAYETWPEILGYCRFSAAPVGRIVLGVFGLSNAVTEKLSDDVCIGLQLANFAQDVARDALLGRTYLVQSDLRERGKAGAVAAMVERARRLLVSGRALERLTPVAGLRLQLALYRLGGLAICDAIVRIGYRTDVQRPQVTKQMKLGLVARAALESFTSISRSRRAEPA